MQEKFNETAEKALIKPAANLSLNLALMPIVTLMPSNGQNEVKFGDPNSYIFSASHEAGLRKGIEDYNTAGGRYYWLFSNVAINLDVIFGVSYNDNALIVMYPGGHWKSPVCDNASGIFDAYLKEVETASSSPATKPRILKLTS